LLRNFRFLIFLNNLNGQRPCPGVPKIKDIDGNNYNTVLYFLSATEDEGVLQLRLVRQPEQQ
jgi:hypothetical protein